ncbi:hypothetical protein [uncultured Desulfosarcina sp.]|uniref:hypothetical protein n=1 Tax=uncultured Desulfosarcina sp. TaxID=218289 RepID=UPI0029C98C3F|nr:hypothetical protein [uncultured Desulfosarcina sp.]
MSAKMFAVRMVVAIIAVIGFVLHGWLGVAPAKWLGLVFYFIKIDAQGDEQEPYTQMKHTATLVFQISNVPKTSASGAQ